MATVSEHYARHLAPICVWMAGGWNEALARGTTEIDLLCADLGPGSAAIDLGSGFGMHAIPLARRGVNVLAIDSSRALLETLRQSAGSLPIRAVEDDLLNFERRLCDQADLIICMGDTLTHLPGMEAVWRLFEGARRALRSTGRLILAFRDYSDELAAEDRFIPVRGDDERILTCFLEYSDRYVTVHDILHERCRSSWAVSVSAYRKLRLPPALVSEALRSHGFDVGLEVVASGMVRVIATCP